LILGAKQEPFKKLKKPGFFLKTWFLARIENPGQTRGPIKKPPKLWRLFCFQAVR
jgi:hypothetical protein